MAMEPQEQPQEQPQGESQEPTGGLKGLIIGINNNLLKLKEVFDSSQEIPQEAKDQIGSVIQGYQSAIQGLAQGGQQPAPEATEPPAPVGGSPAKPPMRGPMAMNSGPNAKPAM